MKIRSLVKNCILSILGDYIGTVMINYILTRPLNKYYNKLNARACNVNKLVIFMADGKVPCWGLCDRLKGILSTYKYCSENNIDFKINFINPFCLDEFLIPNLIDWKISKDEISYNSIDSKGVRMAFVSRKRDITDNILSIMYRLQNRVLSLNYKQLHIYTNVRLIGDSFSVYFHELFKPTAELQNEIDFHKHCIGSSYIAIQFRFLELLGDFKDEDCDDVIELNDLSQRKKMIDSGLKVVRMIKKNNPEYKKILLASDSSTFLNVVKDLEYVYVVPGDIGHSGFVFSKNTNMKTFVDLFMLANAQKYIL